MTTALDQDNIYHPSFKPLLDRIPERGQYSPWAVVEWETWEGHTHMVMVGDGKDSAIRLGGSIEDQAEELVEAMQMCSPDRHKGHGQYHNSDQFRDAYKSAIDQLLSRRYDAERIHAIWLQQMYKKWGGHIPAAVILPTNETISEWQVMIPDHRGDAHFYDVRDGVNTALNEAAGDPGNVTKAPIGYYRRPTWSPDRRMKWMENNSI
jgi:hypothetical protein